MHWFRLCRSAGSVDAACTFQKHCQCRPNCFVLFRSSCLHVVALRDIAADETLSTAFASLDVPRLEQHLMLRQQHRISPFSEQVRALQLTIIMLWCWLSDGDHSAILCFDSLEREGEPLLVEPQPCSCTCCTAAWSAIHMLLPNCRHSPYSIPLRQAGTVQQTTSGSCYCHKRVRKELLRAHAMCNSVRCTAAASTAEALAARCRLNI